MSNPDKVRLSFRLHMQVRGQRRVCYVQVADVVRLFYFGNGWVSDAAPLGLNELARKFARFCPMGLGGCYPSEKESDRHRCSYDQALHLRSFVSVSFRHVFSRSGRIVVVASRSRQKAEPPTLQALGIVVALLSPDRYSQFASFLSGMSGINSGSSSCRVLGETSHCHCLCTLDSAHQEVSTSARPVPRNRHLQQV